VWIINSYSQIARKLFTVKGKKRVVATPEIPAVKRGYGVHQTVYFSAADTRTTLSLAFTILLVKVSWFPCSRRLD